MIHVQIERNKRNEIKSFTMDGHADFAPHGSDIVCAGVTAVSFGTVNAIAKLCHVELETETAEDGGFLRCIVPNGLDALTYEKVQLLLEAMVVALKSIEVEYGKYVRIKNIGG